MTDKQTIHKLRCANRALLATVEELHAIVKTLSHEIPLSPELQALTGRLWEHREDRVQ